MVNLKTALNTTDTLVKLIGSAQQLIQQAGGGENMRRALVGLGAAVAAWRPIRSADARMDLQIAAFIEYARDYLDSHPEDPAARSWLLHGQDLVKRAAIARTLPGRQRRHELAELRQETEGLLKEALLHTKAAYQRPGAEEADGASR